jgi:hypothetical protein
VDSVILAATSPVAAGLAEPVVSHLSLFPDLDEFITRLWVMSDLEVIKRLAELLFRYAE